MTTIQLIVGTIPSCAISLYFLLIVNQKIEIIMSTQIELITSIKELTTQVKKISAESSATLAKVIELQAIIDAGPGVSVELQEAIDTLKAQVQMVDNLTADISLSS